MMSKNYEQVLAIKWEQSPKERNKQQEMEILDGLERTGPNQWKPCALVDLTNIYQLATDVCATSSGLDCNSSLVL